MLGGEREIGLTNELSPAPTYGQTIEASFSKPTQQVTQMAQYIFPGLSTDKQRKETAEKLENINEVLGDPRQTITQHAFNFVSSMAGSLVPTLPLFAAGGAIGAGVAGAIGFGAREIALDLGSEAALSGYLSTQVPLSKLATGALSHYLPEKSISGIAESLVESYGGYKGLIIPEHFEEHYNAVNNTLDTSHAIQDWASDNYGFLLAATPLAAGYVAFKGVGGVIKHRNAKAGALAAEAELKRLHANHAEVLKQNQIKEGETALREAKVSELQDHLQEAEEKGFISPEMHQWYLDYLENPNDMDKVHIGGLKILQDLQIPYDRFTGRVWNQVMGDEGVKNLKNSLFDQELTNFSEEERQLLSSYVVHNELDAYIGNMRDNPNLLHAMKGMTHHLATKIEANSLAIRNFEHALMSQLPKGLLKKQLFSQNNIYQHLKKIGVHSVRDIPYVVPKNVAYMLKLNKQIKDIESRVTHQNRLKYDKGIHLELKKKVKELKSELLHPAQELAHLKDTLMPNGKLVGDFKKRQAYSRLEELSQIWPNAKLVLDRINMEATNAKQQGLNEILKKFIEMVDNTSARIANPDGVKRYLTSRIERAVPVAREAKQFAIKSDPIVEKTMTPEVMYDEASIQQVKKSELDFAREHFEATQKKFEQFSKNTQALDELIKCALGE